MRKKRADKKRRNIEEVKMKKKKKHADNEDVENHEEKCEERRWNGRNTRARIEESEE